jgi:GDP-L-fucose synthase
MEKHAKIYVAGHFGLAGGAICRALARHGYQNLVFRRSKELDLRDAQAVNHFFAAEKPEYVILSAAKVGGIIANSTLPADFIYDNLTIQTNVIHAAFVHKAKKLGFLGSTCVYPRDCPQPIKEEYLLTGPLEKTNDAYAIAKIAGIKMCESYNRQHGTRFFAVMPTNLYGPGDNYDLNHSHVLPAFIRRFHEAKKNQAPSVTLWGTGTPRREFLFCDDMAEGLLYLLNLPESELFGDRFPLFNLGSGTDQTIKELAEIVQKSIGYEGRLEWDTSKPDGTMLKRTDMSKWNTFAWKPKVSLSAGIPLAYQDFLQRYP